MGERAELIAKRTRCGAARGVERNYRNLRPHPRLFRRRKHFGCSLHGDLGSSAKTLKPQWICWPTLTVSCTQAARNTRNKVFAQPSPKRELSAPARVLNTPAYAGKTPPHSPAGSRSRTDTTARS